MQEGRLHCVLAIQHANKPTYSLHLTLRQVYIRQLRTCAMLCSLYSNAPWSTVYSTYVCMYEQVASPHTSPLTSPHNSPLISPHNAPLPSRHTPSTHLSAHLSSHSSTHLPPHHFHSPSLTPLNSSHSQLSTPLPSQLYTNLPSHLFTHLPPLTPHTSHTSHHPPTLSSTLGHSGVPPWSCLPQLNS